MIIYIRNHTLLKRGTKQEYLPLSTKLITKKATELSLKILITLHILLCGRYKAFIGFNVLVYFNHFHVIFYSNLFK